MYVIDLVNLDEVLEHHKDEVRKQASRLAEVGVLEDVKDLGHHSFEVLVVLQDVSCAQSPHLVRDVLQAFAENLRVRADLEIELDIVGILLGEFNVHLDVVFAVGVLLLVRVQQVRLGAQIFDDFAVYFDVLECSMENNQTLQIDRPVVQI